MKTKGLNVIEGVIEKVVLALALVIFLVVFAFQFIGTPTVDLPGVSEPVPIAQATDEVAEAARSKIAQLQDVRVPDDLPSAPNLSTELASKFDGPVFEQPTQIAGVVPGWDAIEGIDATSTDVIVTGENEYAVPTPLAPDNTVAALMMGTVDPSVSQLYPDVADLLPEEQPLDKAFVSVQGDWDAAANRARMAASPSEGQLVLPQDWLRNLEIWDVELVRRELGSDGEWGAETVVPPLPGRPSLRERLAEATPPDISVLVSEEQSLRAGIRQPRMYNLIAGDFWAPPVDFVESSAIQRPAEVERLLRQVRSIRSEIEAVQRRLDNLGGGGGGGGGAGGGGRGSILPQMPDRIFDLDGINPDSIRWPQFADSARAQVGGGGGGGDDEPREDPDEQRRRALERQLERLQTQLQNAIDQLNQLGYDDQGNPLEEAEDEDYASTANLSAASPDTQSIDLWAHDFTAEPGATYQYAIRVKLRNPLFGNASGLTEAQQEFAAQPVIASGLSPWSEPVAIPNLSEYFVVTASDGSLGLAGGSGPTATVEAFRYYYGAWRQHSLRLAAGDSLRATIDIPDGLPRYVISEGENGELVLDEETVIETEFLEFLRDGYLLDVVAGVEQVVTAYFRGEQGVVIPHEPDAERASDRLARMRESAASAADQEFRPIDLTDTLGPRPGRPGQPGVPGPGPTPTPGGPAGPGTPAGPDTPPSPFG
jgi:hypothetical protein